MGLEDFIFGKWGAVILSILLLVSIVGAVVASKRSGAKMKKTERLTLVIATILLLLVSSTVIMPASATYMPESLEIRLMPVETRCIDEPRVETYRIDRNFTVRTEPNHSAPALHTFPAQYVHVLDRYGDWVQISTWLGDGWANTGDPYAYRWDKWGEDEVNALTRMIFGEMRGLSDVHGRMVVRTVLNRLEFQGAYGTTILGITRDRRQFHGYRSSHPILPRYRAMVIAELEAWSSGESGIVYPPQSRCPHYRYFVGRGGFNWFRTQYRGSHCNLC